MSDRQDYLGKGWNFPLKIDLQGGLSPCSAEQKVRQAIPIILRTELLEFRLTYPTAKLNGTVQILGRMRI